MVAHDGMGMMVGGNLPLLIAEILTLTFVQACLAIACLASALTSLAGYKLAWQLLAFALAALVCFFWLWRHLQGDIL